MTGNRRKINADGFPLIDGKSMENSGKQAGNTGEFQRWIRCVQINGKSAGTAEKQRKTAGKQRKKRISGKTTETQRKSAENAEVFQHATPSRRCRPRPENIFPRQALGLTRKSWVPRQALGLRRNSGRYARGMMGACRAGGTAGQSTENDGKRRRKKVCLVPCTVPTTDGKSTENQRKINGKTAENQRKTTETAEEIGQVAVAENPGAKGVRRDKHA